MLVMINKKCEMGCIHCMHDCKPTDKEELSLENIKKITKYANSNYVLNLIITGGEPLIHSNFFEILNYLENNFNGISITITTSGLPLDNKEKRNKLYEVLKNNEKVVLQITSDKNFYKKKINILDDKEFLNLKNVIVVNKLSILLLLGRAKTNNLIPEKFGLRRRNAPACFNSRSIFKTKKDINKAVTTLEGLFKFCGFGFDYNGNFIISECLKSYGTIDELLKDKSIIEKRIIEDFKPCNVCGDCDKLNSQYRKHIESFFCDEFI